MNYQPKAFRDGITKKCPTCGHVAASHISVDLASGTIRHGSWRMGGLPRRESLAMHALAEAYPRGLSKEALIAAVYGAALDHMLDADACLEAHICKLRKRLREVGAPFAIMMRRFEGYWLEML